MEGSKVAVKGKGKKGVSKKVTVTKPVDKEGAPTVIEAYGLKLTLDNSLKKWANDPFFVEKTRIANEKFKSNKSGIDHLFEIRKPV